MGWISWEERYGRGRRVEAELADRAGRLWLDGARGKHPHLTAAGHAKIPRLFDAGRPIEDIGSYVLRDQLKVWVAEGRRLGGAAFFEADWRRPAVLFWSFNKTTPPDTSPFCHAVSHKELNLYDTATVLEVQFSRYEPLPAPTGWVEVLLALSAKRTPVPPEYAAVAAHCDSLSRFVYAQDGYWQPFGVHLHSSDTFTDECKGGVKVFRVITELSDTAEILRAGYGDRAVLPAVTPGRILPSEVNALAGIDRHPIGCPLDDGPIHVADVERSFVFPVHDRVHEGAAHYLHFAAREFDVALYDVLQAHGLVADDLSTLELPPALVRAMDGMVHWLFDRNDDSVRRKEPIGHVVLHGLRVATWLHDADKVGTAGASLHEKAIAVHTDLCGLLSDSAALSPESFAILEPARRQMIAATEDIQRGDRDAIWRRHAAALEGNLE